MTRTERFEMGLAAVMGIGIGWMLSHAMHLPWWATIPLCTVLAGAWYHPKEIIVKVRDQVAPWATLNFVKHTMHIVFLGLHFFLYGIVGLITATILPGAILIVCMMLDSNSPLVNSLAGVVAVLISGGTLLGAMVAMLGAVTGSAVREIQSLPKPGKKPLWAFPIMRRLHRRAIPSNWWFLRHWKKSLIARMCTATMKIPIAQALGIYLLAIVLVDIILTICIAFATTRRMAVMTSAFVGTSVGTVVEFHHPGYLGFSVVIGMIVGGCVGYFWYPVAQILRRSIHETTLSAVRHEYI